MTKKELITDALSLPRSARAALARELAESLDEGRAMTREEWQDAWAEELQHRVDDLESGRVEPVEFSEVVAKAKTLLGDSAS